MILFGQLQYKLKMTVQTKTIREIIYNIPNSITGLRFALSYVAAWLFPEFPHTGCAVLMFSVILDYFDGVAARKYNQCTFFGEVYDWTTDIFTYVIALLWWHQLEPQFIFLLGTLLYLEVIAMLADIITKCYGYHPKLTTDHWTTYILKFTMKTEQRGYSSVGLGYWNTIFHFLCILARVLALSCESQFWNCVFYLCVPMSISYVWMHIGFTIVVLNQWNEEFQERQIRIKFAED